MHAVVVVLGDLGRSPRMQYHALALVRRGATVSLVGYAGAPVISALDAHPGVSIYRLPASEAVFGGSGRRSGRFARGALDRLDLAWRLLWLLGWVIPRPTVLLVQNPPVLPTLPVALAVARLRGARLVIDWHNLSWSVVAMRVGPAHRLVRIIRWLERVCGGRASGHLTVSRAMRRELAGWRKPVDAAVVYDRPAERFVPLDVERREEARRRLLGSHHEAFAVVSSTSWTPDEDFDLLIQAADICEQRLAERQSRAHEAKFLILVTGDGPDRRAFEKRLRDRPPARVRIETRWLSPDDYPTLLGAADLGLCLHRSSSGLDLPMKLADMLGCGLPVCAYDYGPVLQERLVDRGNGRLFSTAGELASLILEMHEGFPASPTLAALRQQTLQSDRTGWERRWDSDAGPTVLGTLQEA